MVEPTRAAFFDLRDRHRCHRSRRALRQAVERHRSAGDLLVLVAPRDTLEQPHAAAEHGIAALGIGADLVVRPEPEQPACPEDDPGVVTVVEAIILLGLDASRCFGYVDHTDGLRTLSVVGNPRVVGPDPELSEHACSHGWPMLVEAAPSSHPPDTP
ncbi:hypothetical protein P3T35_000597 [Kitasatospora sp. GP30]|uniref:hypothetical protein n=1 Tax=Kitasatospora sp. GP30 TaxID=3035084 RepID=UPI000C70C103|nr:hypothetical protein [Kitasatospora sp. GP30]MDH6138620.1 hypothetical protein [Kitasatospora sp. GP30]